MAFRFLTVRHQQGIGRFGYPQGILRFLVPCTARDLSSVIAVFILLYATPFCTAKTPRTARRFAIPRQTHLLSSASGQTPLGTSCALRACPGNCRFSADLNHGSAKIAGETGDPEPKHVISDAACVLHTSADGNPICSPRLSRQEGKFRAEAFPEGRDTRYGSDTSRFYVKMPHADGYRQCHYSV